MITILITTCDRYDTSLPLTLMSIINQSLKPNRIVLVDDSKDKKFYNHKILQNILILLKEYNIEFDYFYGESKGSSPALKIGLDNIVDGWVFKIDDDNILPYNALELFNKNIKPNIGAMSGIITDEVLSNYYKDIPENIPQEKDGYYNRIEDIFTDLNIQMYKEQDDKIKKVEHIYSNYFFRRDLADDDHPFEQLSPSAHRDETIFTYNIFKKGYDLIVIPQVKIFHLHNKTGNSKWDAYKDNNERFFLKKLEEWKIVPDKLEIYDDGNMITTKRGDKTYLII